MMPQGQLAEDHARKVPRLVDHLAVRPGLRIVELAWSSGLVVAARSD